MNLRMVHPKGRTYLYRRFHLLHEFDVHLDRSLGAQETVPLDDDALTGREVEGLDTAGVAAGKTDLARAVGAASGASAASGAGGAPTVRGVTGMAVAAAACWGTRIGVPHGFSVK